MCNIGAHDNHKLLSYHDNERLRYDYHTIDIIAHHYIEMKSRETSEVVYICRYTSTHLIPNLVVGIV